MYIADVTRVLLYTDRKRVNRFLKFLLIAIRETNVIINIRFIGMEGLVLKRLLESLDTFFVFFESVKGQTQAI
jgi:hypothetical protein